MDSEEYKGVIFLLGPPTSNTVYARMGYKKAGYFFPTTFTSNTHFHKTLGHELGHGVFDLKHPFLDTLGDDVDHEEYYSDDVNRDCYHQPSGGAPRPSTSFKDSDNLMDYYEQGILPRAYQWNLIKEKLITIEQL